MALYRLQGKGFFKMRADYRENNPVLLKQQGCTDFRPQMFRWGQHITGIGCFLDSWRKQIK